MAMPRNIQRCLVLGYLITTILPTGFSDKTDNRLRNEPDNLPTIEDSFKTIHKMDDQECIPRLLCEMAASAKKQSLTDEEASILAVFSNEKTQPDKNGKSPLSIYKFATNIGTLGSEDDRCLKNFSKCPLTGKDLMTAFKTIVIGQ